MTNHDLLETLVEKAVLLGDGAMGTELYKRGLPPGCLEQYNISNPEVIRDVHLSYLGAGSEIIETNSFGGNRLRLGMYGLADRVEVYNYQAASLARQVCPKGKLVVGSIGPLGGALEPFGDISQNEALDVFCEQVKALALGGVDAICIETMESLDEAQVAVRAVKNATDLPIIATMTFQLGSSGICTAWGSTVSDMVRKLCNCGADVIGANCGRGFEEMVVIARELRTVTNAPVIVQPNAGLPRRIGDSVVYDQTPDTIRPHVAELLRTGVNVIGGCCGTGPEHIRMMREVIDSIV